MSTERQIDAQKFIPFRGETGAYTAVEDAGADGSVVAPAGRLLETRIVNAARGTMTTRRSL